MRLSSLVGAHSAEIPRLVLWLEKGLSSLVGRLHKHQSQDAPHKRTGSALPFPFYLIYRLQRLREVEVLEWICPLRLICSHWRGHKDIPFTRSRSVREQILQWLQGHSALQA